MKSKFEQKYPELSDRLERSDRILKKYPDRIPIIAEKHYSSKLPDIDKTQYLVPRDMCAGNFVCVLRKRLKLGPTDAIYLFVNGSLVQSHISMHQLYEDNKSSDRFLYVIFMEQQTYG